MDNKGFVSDGLKSESNPVTAKQNERANRSLSEEGTSGDEKWGKEIEFLMSCIALSIGLGNIWRFPFVALDNGGGAFIIPYVTVLIFVGKPFYYMETAIGQFSGRTNIKMFDFAPIMRGVGYGMFFANSVVATYYASLMALTFRYLVVSFASELPWSKCREEWGPTCMNADLSGNLSSTEVQKITSAQFYFTKVVLREKTQIDDGIGYPNWDLSLCLAFSWFMVAIVMIKGIQSSGKASYFLALFPYFTLFILLIRALTLPGAADGVLYFITPQWDKLLSPSVWYAALTKCFFSLSIGFGSLIIYSSYNTFSHNVYRDSNIVTTLDTFTSLLSGVVIFGILGNLAHETGTKDISKVTMGGTSLAFISYPDAISKFAFFPQGFSVLFFFMLFVLGVGSEVGVATGVVRCIKDIFPNTKHSVMVWIFSTYNFAIGLIYMTPGGQFVLNFIDYYGVTFVLLVIAIGETIAIGWIYGVKRFCMDIKFMLNRETSLYFRLCWAVITPIFMIVVLIYTFVGYEPIQYNGYTYTNGIYSLGWCISSIGILQIVIWAVIGYYNQPKGKNRFLRGIQPMDTWGPSNKKKLAEYQEMIVKMESGNSLLEGRLAMLKNHLFG